MYTRKKRFSFWNTYTRKYNTLVLYMSSSSKTLCFDFWTGRKSSFVKKHGIPMLELGRLHTMIRSHQIYARELRSRSGCGRPRVGVGGLWMLSSYRSEQWAWYEPTVNNSCSKMKITMTHLHPCVICCTLGRCLRWLEGRRQGMNQFWNDNQPPSNNQYRSSIVCGPWKHLTYKATATTSEGCKEKHEACLAYRNNWWQRKEWSTVPEQTFQTHP